MVLHHHLHTGILTHICTLQTLIHHTHLHLQPKVMIHMHIIITLIHILILLHIPSTIPIPHLLDHPLLPPILAP